MSPTADFTHRAQDVLLFLDVYRGRHERPRMVELANEQFITHEQRPELRQLAQLLLLARQQSELQRALDADRAQLHSGRLAHEARVTVGHHYEMMRRDACEYNHHLRGFVEANREHVSRADLTDWLTTASHGRRPWVEGEVTGAISEVALHAALMGLPELRQLRYGTVAEDLQGFDFIASWQGRVLSVDAKTGRFHPVMARKHDHLHLEVSVPREALDGFRLGRHGLDLLRRDIRRALHEAVGVNVHAAHAPYRPASVPVSSVVPSVISADQTGVLIYPQPQTA